MGHICCLCGNKMDHYTYFRIPKDERRRKQWSDICRMEFPDNARICADHFVESHMVKNTRCKWLAPCAVPCLNVAPKDPIAITAADIAKNNIQPKEVIDLRIAPVKEPPYKDVGSQTRFSRSKEEKKVEQLEANNRNLQEDIERLNRKIEQQDAALSTMKKIFTQGQMRKIMKPNHSRWLREEIANAIRLHANGPKAYAYLLKQGYPFPPVGMLEHWCRKVVIDEGFLSTSLGFFRHCAELTNEDKICVLAFGEINLEDNSCVQIVVAQGLWKSWRRPIYFNYDQKMKKTFLLSIIEKLHKATFPVVAVVCDAKQKNLQLWKSLGVTTVRPWFAHPVNAEEKVYTFADASILLEHLRNQFIDPGLLFNNELLTGHTISDVINHNLCSDLKLTNDHIAADMDGRAELAVELFSKSTANSLRACHSNGITLYKPSETADFIELISDWYDIMNSSVDTFSISGKEPFGMNLSEQKSILIRINKWLAYNIVPNKVVLEDFQEAIIISNTALVLLHNHMTLKYGMAYVLANRLNFQELKHLLNAIRSKGEAQAPLTRGEFRNRLKKYIYAQNIMHFHGTINLVSGANIDHSSASKTVEGDKVVAKRKSSEEIAAHTETPSKKAFIEIDVNKELPPQENSSGGNIDVEELPQQVACDEINSAHIGHPAEPTTEFSDANNKLMQEAASEQIITLDQVEQNNAIGEIMRMNEFTQHLDSVPPMIASPIQNDPTTTLQPRIISISQTRTNIIPIRNGSTMDFKNCKLPISARPTFRLIGGKIIKIPKVKIEIISEVKKPPAINNEIVAERDPVILDQVDTANVHDVGTFVEDALKYISDYAYSEKEVTKVSCVTGS